MNVSEIVRIKAKLVHITQKLKHALIENKKGMGILMTKSDAFEQSRFNTQAKTSVSRPRN